MTLTVQSSVWLRFWLSSSPAIPKLLRFQLSRFSLSASTVFQGTAYPIWWLKSDCLLSSAMLLDRWSLMSLWSKTIMEASEEPRRKRWQPMRADSWLSPFRNMALPRVIQCILIAFIIAFIIHSSVFIIISPVNAMNQKVLPTFCRTKRAISGARYCLSTLLTHYIPAFLSKTTEFRNSACSAFQKHVLKDQWSNQSLKLQSFLGSNFGSSPRQSSSKFQSGCKQRNPQTNSCLKRTEHDWRNTFFLQHSELQWAPQYTLDSGMVSKRRFWWKCIFL